MYPRFGPGLGRFGKGTKPFGGRIDRATAPFKVSTAMKNSTSSILNCCVYAVASADELLGRLRCRESALALLSALAPCHADLEPSLFDDDEDEDDDLGIEEEEEDLDFDEDDEDLEDEEEEEEGEEEDLDADLDEEDLDEDQDVDDDEDDFWDEEEEEEDDFLEDEEEEEEIFDDEEEEE